MSDGYKTLCRARGLFSLLCGSLLVLGGAKSPSFILFAHSAVCFLGSFEEKGDKDVWAISRLICLLLFLPVAGGINSFLIGAFPAALAQYLYLCSTKKNVVLTFSLFYLIFLCCVPEEWDEAKHALSHLGPINHKIAQNALTVGFWMSAISSITQACLSFVEATHATERMKLQVAVEAAEARSISRAKLTTTISHELRTPVTAICGILELFGDCEIDGKAQELLADLKHSSRTLLTLLNDILTFASLDEKGTVTVDCSPVVPQQILKDVCSTLNVLAKPGVQLVHETDPEIVNLCRYSSLCSDAVRIFQIAVNFTGNALKFTHSGKVSLRFSLVSRAQPSSPGLKTRRHGRDHDQKIWLRLEVSDTGIGISEDKLQNVFEPYFQASAASKYGGTGLGLAICVGLAKALGGRVEAQSELGVGSCFSFICPFKVRPLETKVVEAPPTFAPSTVNATCLLAEDDDINRKIVGRMLTKLGFKVFFACNGEEAVRMVRSLGEDLTLVLMDFNMPVMDGLTAARTLRESAREAPWLEWLPIVALTAGTPPSDIDNTGLDGFLSKPVSSAALKALIETIVADKMVWLRNGLRKNTLKPPPGSR